MYNARQPERIQQKPNIKQRFRKNTIPTKQERIGKNTKEK